MAGFGTAPWSKIYKSLTCAEIDFQFVFWPHLYSVKGVAYVPLFLKIYTSMRMEGKDKIFKDLSLFDKVMRKSEFHTEFS